MIKVYSIKEIVDATNSSAELSIVPASGTFHTFVILV